jgi:hypothetical protein
MQMRLDLLFMSTPGCVVPPYPGLFRFDTFSVKATNFCSCQVRLNTVTEHYFYEIAT